MLSGLSSVAAVAYTCPQTAEPDLPPAQGQGEAAEEDCQREAALQLGAGRPEDHLQEQGRRAARAHQDLLREGPQGLRGHGPPGGTHSQFSLSFPICGI